MPTAPTSSEELLSLLRKSGIVSAEKLAELPQLPAEAAQAAAVLVTRGIVTRFQAQQLLAGRHKGFRLGPYAIQDLLGRGGMGAVYLAEHVELHRKVALKVLVPGRDEDQKLALERFLREARAAAALDHPNIVRIFDVCRQGETPFLVMEYVEGETLQQILDRDGMMPYPIATEYIAQAAAGLQHAYEKGFVHRDIKPVNLMRDKSGTIKILDMGLARSGSSRDRLTEQLDSGAVVGTADFIAPEQGLNQPDVDIRADIYSLGATFFALLVGKPPFEGNTTQKLLQHQLKPPPSLTSLDPTLPQGLSAVVAKMLAKKPQDRYQTPAEVIAALAPWMGHSARIIAGLSRTNLAQGVDLHATLTEMVRVGSSRRLGPLAPVADTSLVDPSGAVTETATVPRSATIRDQTPLGPAARRPEQTGGRLSRSKILLFSGLGVAVLLAGAFAGWLVAGGKKPVAAAGSGPDSSPRPLPTQPKSGSDGPAPNSSIPASNPPPPSVQPEPPTSAPSPPPSNRPPTLRFAFDGQKPFVIRSGLRADPKDPEVKHYRSISHTGAKPPVGWSGRSWNLMTEMEFFSEAGENPPSVGIRNVAGPASAMLFMPSFEAPDGFCRIRFEYRADVRRESFLLRFRPSDNRPAWDIVRPPVTGSAWRTEELEVDLRGATGGFFEFHNGDERPTASLRLRWVEVTPLRGAPEKLHYRFDAADWPDFRQTLQGRNRVSGPAVQLPPGLVLTGWKPETQSVWECGLFAGVRALAYANLNEPVSAQIALELERANGLGLTLRPGNQLRVRVVYRTTGTATGSMYFQDAGGKRRTFGWVTLPNSNEDWLTVDAIGTRGDQPLRFLIDNRSVGEGNRLIVRSISVTEVPGTPTSDGSAVPPDAKMPPPPDAKMPPPPDTPAPGPKAAADDFADWVEGRRLYSLDVAAIPEFRVRKELTGPLGDERERLPAGVSAQCWKEASVGEFRRQTVGGVPALGVTNLNEVLSAQFAFELETQMKIPLEPGKVYRVKVGYLTKNEAAGGLHVHVTPGYRSLVYREMPNSGERWTTFAVSFRRPAAEEKVDVRMTIDNTTAGEGNTLWIRSLEVVELLPPDAKK